MSELSPSNKAPGGPSSSDELSNGSSSGVAWSSAAPPCSKTATPAPPGGVRNIHGRRPGRGARPYLIVVKILAVTAFVGGLATVLLAVLWTAEPTDVAAWRDQTGLIGRIYTRVIIPGSTVAILTGVLLAASIWRVMVRMRWFVAKMLLIAAAMPSLHLFLRSRAAALHEVLAAAVPDLARAGQLRQELFVGTAAALFVAVAAIVLGRVKPRLGQDYGRTFARFSRPQ